MEKNSNLGTVKGFGDEWSRFEQTSLSPHELQDLFNRFFRTFPLDTLPRIEKRFTADQIQKMMEDSGLERIVFSDTAPYRCAVGYKKTDVRRSRIFKQ